MYELTYFCCGFCHKKFSVKCLCEQHEETCPDNPLNHGCGTCSHCQEYDHVPGEYFCDVKADALFDDDVDEYAPHVIHCPKWNPK